MSKENVYDEKYGWWETLSRLFMLNIKVLWNNYMVIVLGFFIPFFITLGISVFLPIWFSFILFTYISMLMCTSVTFGSLMYTYSTTTMNDNISLTSIKKETTIFSIWFSMLVMSLITILGISFSMFFWETIGIAGVQFTGQNLDPIPNINWKHIDWPMVFYYWFVFTSIVFCFSLFLQRFIKERNTFYVVIMTYLILTFFLGETISFTWNVSSDGNVEFMEAGSDESKWIGALDPYLKGSSMYFFAQFFPTTHINEFAFATVLKGTEAPMNSRLDGMVQNVNSINMFVPHGRDWKIMFIAPYLNMGGYYLIYRLTTIIK